MKILFIVPRSLNPKQTYAEYPLGVGYIGTYLYNAGHEVLIYDQSTEGGTETEVIDYALLVNPDIIAFSIITPVYPIAKILVRLCKERISGKPLIAGGIHANLFPQDLLNDGIDVVVLGNGEQIFIQIIECYEHFGKFFSCDTVLVAEHLKTVEMPIHRDEKLEKEQLVLNRDLYNLPLYTHHSILATRGCPFNCRFCCNYSQIFSEECSIREVDSVIAEMMTLEQKHHADKVFFVDDVFFLSKERISQFCAAYKQAHLKIKWIAQLRVDTIDRKLAEQMFDSGCVRVYFGVESGSQTILDNAQKNITLKDIIEGIRICKDVGLRVKTGWIYGLPGAFEEQLKSIDLMSETMPNEISIHELIPFPGTDYYNHSEQYGIEIVDKKDFTSFCYGGIGENFKFNYLSKEQFMLLLEKTSSILESLGYVNSDLEKPNAQFVYSSPLSAMSMKVFK